MPLRFLLLSLEPYLYTKLINSPTWHRMVGFVHRKVNRIPHEQGGTSLDDPNRASFLKYMAEELKSQLPGRSKVIKPKPEPPSTNVADDLRRKWDIKK